MLRQVLQNLGKSHLVFIVENKLNNYLMWQPLKNRLEQSCSIIAVALNGTTFDIVECKSIYTITCIKLGLSVCQIEELRYIPFFLFIPCVRLSRLRYELAWPISTPILVCLKYFQESLHVY